MTANSDKIKKKILKIYQNYGINTSEMDEGEVERITNYYLENPKQLDIDGRESAKHEGKFPDDEIL